MNLRVSRQQRNTPTDTPGTEEIGSACSVMTRDLHTLCSESAMLDDDDSDWLHRNGTYMRDMRSLEEQQNMSTSFGPHDQDSFLTKSAYSEKKRQHDSSEQTRQRHRERYSLMPDEQRDICLQKNRVYKKSLRDTRTKFDQEYIVAATTGSTITSHCTPIIQAQSSKNQPTGDTDDDVDFDPTGIFEPIEQGAILEDNLDTIQEEQTMHDDDEE